MVQCVNPYWPTEQPSLMVELRPADGQSAFCFQLFPGTPGVTVWVRTSPTASTAEPNVSATGDASVPSGVELDPIPTAKTSVSDPIDVIESLSIDPLHTTLTRVELHEQTDRHNNLVFEHVLHWHPSERLIDLQGTLFHLQDKLTGNGLIFLKLAPQPYARPINPRCDLTLTGDAITTLGHGIDTEGGDGYRSVILAYRDGDIGRIRVLQAYQRQLRPYVPGRDGRFITNTWGDRSRDGALNEHFMLGEIDAAAELGADVVQIDDGWQRGTTANSVTKGGVWNAFWDAGDDFWTPHPNRFPNGLTPIVDRARARGLGVGLWYAIDSSNDATHWRRDAEQVLQFRDAYGVETVKIDAVKMHSRRGERNILSFYNHVLEASENQVVFDHDVTAEMRPGYFGLPHVGPVFVENRYTDWRNYWPHATLRNLWQLARHIDPVRLRIEFLNATRNADKYGPDDPLAPVKYDPAYLFAITMFASPLGWFECTSLPVDVRARIGALAAIWRNHRAAIHAGTILPIGQAPDGAAWTGFLSVDRRGSSPDAYLLAFRELHRDQTHAFTGLPLNAERYDVQWLWPTDGGSISAADGKMEVHLSQPLQFAFAKLTARH